MVAASLPRFLGVQPPRSVQLRTDLLGQALAFFHAPLVEGVDVPDDRQGVDDLFEGGE